jgi:DNA-binding response OmpR family regulator
MRKVLALWLRAAGYQVDILPSGEERALLNGSARPDLILFDYDLPNDSGPDLLNCLRDADHLEGVPILALSADEPPTGSSSDGTLATAWLTKPCDVGELSVWLVRLLGSPLEPHACG